MQAFQKRHSGKENTRCRRRIEFLGKYAVEYIGSLSLFFLPHDFIHTVKWIHPDFKAQKAAVQEKNREGNAKNPFFGMKAKVALEALCDYLEEIISQEEGRIFRQEVESLKRINPAGQISGQRDLFCWQSCFIFFPNQFPEAHLQAPPSELFCFPHTNRGGNIELLHLSANQAHSRLLLPKNDCHQYCLCKSRDFYERGWGRVNPIGSGGV